MTNDLVILSTVLVSVHERERDGIKLLQSELSNYCMINIKKKYVYYTCKSHLRCRLSS